MESSSKMTTDPCTFCTRVFLFARILDARFDHVGFLAGKLRRPAMVELGKMYLVSVDSFDEAS